MTRIWASVRGKNCIYIVEKLQKRQTHQNENIVVLWFGFWSWCKYHQEHMGMAMTGCSSTAL